MIDQQVSRPRAQQTPFQPESSHYIGGSASKEGVAFMMAAHTITMLQLGKLKQLVCCTVSQWDGKTCLQRVELLGEMALNVTSPRTLLHIWTNKRRCHSRLC